MRKYKTKLRSVVIGVFLGLTTGAVLLLCSCAARDTGSIEDVERVIETFDGEPVALAEEILSVDGTIQVMAAEADESVDVVEEAEPERYIEAIEVSKDYLKDMSEDELVSLSKEALEASGMDTSLADGELVTGGISFELPEGFKASEDDPNMFVLKRYPIDASNIVYSELDVDYTLQLADEDYFKEMVSSAFDAGCDEQVNVDITEFKHYTIDGVPAIRLKCEYDLEDNHMTQLMIAINGSKTYVLCFTQTQDYDRMEEFEACADSIRIMP